MTLPPLRQNNILHIMCILKQRCNIVIVEAGNAAADTSDKEGEMRMFLGKLDELIDIRTDGLYSTLHSRNTVTMTL